LSPRQSHVEGTKGGNVSKNSTQREDTAKLQKKGGGNLQPTLVQEKVRLEKKRGEGRNKQQKSAELGNCWGSGGRGHDPKGEKKKVSTPSKEWEVVQQKRKKKGCP